MSDDTQDHEAPEVDSSEEETPIPETDQPGVPEDTDHTQDEPEHQDEPEQTEEPEVESDSPDTPDEQIDEPSPDDETSKENDSEPEESQSSEDESEVSHNESDESQDPDSESELSDEQKEESTATTNEQESAPTDDEKSEEPNDEQPSTDDPPQEPSETEEILEDKATPVALSPKKWWGKLFKKPGGLVKRSRVLIIGLAVVLPTLLVVSTAVAFPYVATNYSTSRVEKAASPDLETEPVIPPGAPNAEEPSEPASDDPTSSQEPDTQDSEQPEDLVSEQPEDPTADVSENPADQQAVPTGNVDPLTVGEKPYTDLGIRTLPLLSDEAKANYRENPYQAYDTAMRKAFGDWSTEEMFYDSVSSYAPEENAIDGLSMGLEDHISYHVGGRESDALDFIGLALLNGTTLNYPKARPGPTNFGLASARRIEEIYHSCDSSLTRAYAANLIDSLDMDPASLKMRWTNAINNCPDDPTPVIEYARSRLSAADQWAYTFWGNISARRDPWVEQASTIDDIISELPDLPATYVLAGDAYRNLVTIPLQPFVEAQPVMPDYVEKLYLRKAVEAYARAAAMTSAPEVRVSWAAALLALSDIDKAQEVLNSLSAEEQKAQSAINVQASIFLNQGEAKKAQKVLLSIADTTPAMEPVMYRGAFTCRTPLTFIMTHPAGSLIGPPVYGQYGCHAYQGLYDNGVVPEHRIGKLMFGPTDPLVAERYPHEQQFFEAEVALLAEDWSATTICGSSHSMQGVPDYRQMHVLCRAFQAQGNISQLSDKTIDIYQDFYRWYGFYDEAKIIAEQWIEQSPKTPEAYDRYAEILLLLGDYPASAQASENAIDLYHSPKVCQSFYDWSDSCVTTGPGWAMVRQAQAQRLAGKPDNASELLDGAKTAHESFYNRLDFNTHGWADSPDPKQLRSTYLTVLSSYISQERGLLATHSGEYEDALPLLKESIELRHKVTWYKIPFALDDGTTEQAISGAYLAMGENRQALTWAQKALDCDPYHPDYLVAWADVKSLLMVSTPGGITSAQESSSEDSTQARMDILNAYRKALTTDPTLWKAWNNLGVLQAQMGDGEAAVASLRQAAQVNPDFGLAWFNLSLVQESLTGLSSYVDSQGAMRKALELDPTLADAPHVLTIIT
ncbi:MAG: hypothetical protein FWG08_03810 [Propionibacteriaceae bacterium]|nr:hypothetical protein [Propionibacteriaceae bacterium]